MYLIVPLVISPTLATINIKCNVRGYFDMNDEFMVNGLPLPPLLVELMKQDGWQHPGVKLISKVIPSLLVPIIFLKVMNMQFESEGFAKFADGEFSSELFHANRGSSS